VRLPSQALFLLPSVRLPPHPEPYLRPLPPCPRERPARDFRKGAPSLDSGFGKGLSSPLQVRERHVARRGRPRRLVRKLKAENPRGPPPREGAIGLSVLGLLRSGKRLNGHHRN
jgi:hypothetical protein